MNSKFDITSLINDRNITLDKTKGKRKKFWFNNCMFKYQKNGSLESYAEIFASLLLQKIKISCAEYCFGYYENSVGVITKSFLNSSEKLISGADLFIDVYENIADYSDSSISKMMIKNNVVDISNSINKYIKKYNFISNEKTINGLYLKILDMCVIDTILLQTDRNPFNWGIIIDSTKKVKIAPLYDNSNMANLNTPEFINKHISKINMDEINKFIDNVEAMSITRKEFYKKILFFKNLLLYRRHENNII